MSDFRKNMMKTASEVISGERQGNKKAALIAHSLGVWVETRDLIFGETTTDEQLNAEIVAAIKAELSL